MMRRVLDWLAWTVGGLWWAVRCWGDESCMEDDGR